MTPAALLQTLAGPWGEGTRPKDLFAAAIRPNPAAYVEPILAGLASRDRRVQGGCAELASCVAAEFPGLLYPSAEVFLRALTARAPILRWEAACTLGHLAAVDAAGVTRAAVPALVAHLRDPSIVLQGHAARALARIGTAFPDLAPAVLDELISAEAHFPGTRVGYLVEAMAAFPGQDAARAFATRHAASPLAPVATKARRVLRGWGRSAT